MRIEALGYRDTHYTQRMNRKKVSRAEKCEISDASSQTENKNIYGKTNTIL